MALILPCSQVWSPIWDTFVSRSFWSSWTIGKCHHAEVPVNKTYLGGLLNQVCYPHAQSLESSKSVVGPVSARVSQTSMSKSVVGPYSEQHLFRMVYFSEVKNWSSEMFIKWSFWLAWKLVNVVICREACLNSMTLKIDSNTEPKAWINVSGISVLPMCGTGFGDVLSFSSSSRCTCCSWRFWKQPYSCLSDYGCGLAVHGTQSSVVLLMSTLAGETLLLGGWVWFRLYQQGAYGNVALFYVVKIPRG